MTTPNNTPPRMTKEEVAILWQSSRLKITDSFTTPPEILNVGDSVIGTLGNFSTSTGKSQKQEDIQYNGYRCGSHDERDGFKV